MAVTDTNCDPDVIDYIIPGNDDAIRAIKLFVTAMAEACVEGAAMRKENGDEEPEAAMQKAAEQEVVEAAPETAADVASEATDKVAAE